MDVNVLSSINKGSLLLLYFNTLHINNICKLTIHLGDYHMQSYNPSG